eukprot:scaffold1879_cov71-Phaeocystis_antarctica.AAC.3
MFAHAVVSGEDASGQRLRPELLSFVRQYPGSNGSRAREDPDSLHSDPIGHRLQDTLPAAVFDARRVLARLRKPGALLASASIDPVDQRLEGVDATRNSQASRAPRTHWASLTVTVAHQTFATTDLASFTSGGGGASGCAPGGYGARLASFFALLALEAAGRTLVARAHLGARCDCAWAALDLLRAARRCIKARVSRRALIGAAEVGGAGIRTLLARQCCTGALGAERAGLAGDARLLALAGLKAAAEAAATKPAEQLLQSAGSELPGIGLAFPGAHAWHDALFFWPTSGLNVPAGHGVNVCRRLAAPSAEQEPPRGQSLHSVELTFSLNLPAGHVKQRVPPSSGL